MTKLFIHPEDQAVQKICKKDPLMAKLINYIGPLDIALRTDYFASIIRSIVGQQISVSAARTIYNRLNKSLEGAINAEAIDNKSTNDLKSVGLTERKVSYIKDLSEKVLTNELDLINIDKYSDREVIDQLINVKGIGKWTAEMFLLLSLAREDILAIDDVGIQRAAKWLYEVDQSDRRKILIEKSPLWKPYRSVVSFYLWEAIHLGLVSNYNSINEI